MIDAIRKPKNRSFKQSVYLSYSSSFVTIPEFSEYLMDRQNDSLAKYFSQYRSRNSASVGARVNNGNVLVMSENRYSFDQCPKHKTDSPFTDPIDMHGFFFFLGRQCSIEATRKQRNRISFCQQTRNDSFKNRFRSAFMG